VTGPGTLQVALERAMHKAVRVKSKTQWEPQEVIEAKNTECLLMKNSGHQVESAQETGCMGYKQQSNRGPHTQNASHEATRFNACCTGFWSYFWFNPSLLFSHSPFWNGNIYSMSLYFGICNFLSHRDSQLTVCFESQKRLWTWTFEQYWNC
jgi:hypothetical protein